MPFAAGDRRQPAGRRDQAAPGDLRGGATALGDPPPDAILHVGDDWAADVVGAARAGWRAAYVDRRPADSPLPSSERDGSVEPDLEIGSIAELGPLFGDRSARRRLARDRALSAG